MSETQPNGNRRIDRITAPGFVEGLRDLSLGELRHRRDECLAEREYLSLLRRLVQGRLDIVRAEVDRRRTGGDPSTLVDHVAHAMSHEEHPTGSSRGEAVRLTVPPDEMTLARRRVESLVADSALSDPRTLPDDELGDAMRRLEAEELTVSADRKTVMGVHDLLQDELKRRFKENPAEALTP
ncbi:MAG TPA: aerial mycelium formation protein [Actinomycetota bacterium]|jgi:hypothetical protein